MQHDEAAEHNEYKKPAEEPIDEDGPPGYDFAEETKVKAISKKQKV